MRYRDAKGKGYSNVFKALLSDTKDEINKLSDRYLPGMKTVLGISDYQDPNGMMPASTSEQENLLADIIRGCGDIIVDYHSSKLVILDHDRHPLAEVEIDMTEFKERLNDMIIDAFTSDKSSILYVPKSK